MTIIKQLILALLLVLSSSISAHNQFFNLTKEDVKIDSLLPYFSHSIPLNQGYADSTYTVSILYPEFIDMTSADIAMYKHQSGAPLPSLPQPINQVAISRKQASLQIGFSPLVFRDNRYQLLVSFMLHIEAQPIIKSKKHNTTATRANDSQRYAQHSVLATGKWAKISVKETGVYQLTEEVIRQAGFTDLTKVKIYGYGGKLQNEQLVPQELIDTDDLHEIATCMVDGKRLFYGYGTVSWTSDTATKRTRNPYSDYGYYFITQTDEAAKTIDSTAFIQSFYPSPHYYHTHYEVDTHAYMQGGRNLFDPLSIANGSSKTYDISSNAPLGTAKMAINVASNGVSQIAISHNGTEKGKLNTNLIEFDAGNEANNVYAIERTNTTDEVTIATLSGNPSRLDYITFIWNSPLPAPTLRGNSFPTAQYVHNITNQDLHGHDFADMIIIIPTSQKLRAQAERLKAFREEHDGLRVTIVSANELYNEFSSGTPDANAYRRYLKMLYDRAENNPDNMPKYLLLFGDGVWDNRMLTKDCKQLNPDDYLLCYESENSFNKVHSYVDDGFFCTLDDYEGNNSKFADKQDVAVGRFPVTTDAQAKVLVDKVIAYTANNHAGAWQNTLVFMGDDGDNNLHMRDMNLTAQQVSNAFPGFLSKKIMWDAYQMESSISGNSYPEVSRLIKQYQNNGALIMNYGGHGSEVQISHESVLRITDFDSFTNYNTLPLWITAACDIMPFDGTTPNIGETAILNPQGGAVAFFGTTRTVYAYYNSLINRAFLQYVLAKDANNKPYTLGEAQRLAKNFLISSTQDLTYNKLQYSLLGDPAMALHLPTAHVLIDSINGIAVQDAQNIQLKSGSIVTISGHIAGQSAFNGTLTATIQGSKETITCRQNNNTETKSAFSFEDRPNTLFSGSQTVKDGKFTFSFAIPLDINYTDGQGVIHFYAINDEKTVIANGYNDSFTIGGSAQTANDSIGPSIYCYLNDPSFTNGSNVNSTPYFVATITDENGINVSGNGIGHDLQLVIDGEPAKTYSLNDYFQYDFGSHTTGSAHFHLPELSAGLHHLTFKAWDILNNSSTTQLTFNVVRGLQPKLFSIGCTHNPAKTNTTFIINHDRNGGNIDIEIEVFDPSGRQLWRHCETGVTTSQAYTIDWDLRIDGGARLQAGVYLYQVRIAAGGSQQVSKAKKLIIVGNK